MRKISSFPPIILEKEQILQHITTESRDLKRLRQVLITTTKKILK